MASGRVGDAAGSGSISVVDTLLAALRAATEEERTAFFTEWRALEGRPAATAPKKSVGRPRKEPVATAAPALPTSDGDAPSAAAYRLKPEDIDMSTCLGRKLAGEDKRWKPFIFRESQCGAAVEEGCDLCKTCQRRLEKFAEEPKAGPWTGRVTEEPLGWVHMLGTEWAETKKPRWAPDGVSVSDAVSEASAPSAASSKKSAAEKAAAAEAKKAEKEAAKAAKAAAAAAEKAAKKAEKEAEKAAKAAEKEAAKAAKAAKAATEKEAKKADAKKPAAAASTVVAAKAATETEAADAAGELKLIDGTLYMVRAGNVYEYDEISEKAGDFVGRLTADETIDTEAEEEATETL